jgi:hypothetical protein
MTAIGVAVDGEYLWAKMHDALDSAPSIDIVRCKECRYRKNRADYEKEYCLQHSKVLYDTGGGCSWGKGVNDE